MKHLLVVIIIPLLYSCHPTSSSRESSKEISIALQPFKGVDSLFTHAVLNYLSTNSNNSILLLPVEELPRNAYLPERKRYSADSIISFLRKGSREEHQKVIGLTTFDIETSLEGKKYWGIMGLGYCPGPSAIISSHRLKKRQASESVVLNRTINVCLHEIGHNFSLPHCSRKNCIMVAAKGGMPGGLIGRFCANCLKTLHEKGWKYHQPPTTYSQHAENK